MGLFDGIFGSTQNTSNSTTTSSYPDWYMQGEKGILQAGTQIASRPYAAYPGQRIAGATPDQTQAYDLTRDQAGTWGPLLDSASGAIGSALGKSAYGAGSPLIQQGAGMSGVSSASPLVSAASQTFPGSVAAYMSPYTGQVTDRIADLGVRNLNEKILPGLNSTFVGGGSFGGSRNNLFVDRAVRDTQDSILGQQAQALEQGYSTAGNLFNSDQSRLAGLAGTVGNLTEADAQRLLQSGSALGQLTTNDVTAALQGANQYASLAQQKQNQSLKDAAALEAIGQEQQQEQQKNLDLGVQDFTNQRDWDANQLGWLSSLASGQQVPKSSSTTTTTPGTPALQTLGGTALTLAGLFKKEGGRVRGYADGGAVDDDGSDDGDDLVNRLSTLDTDDILVLARQSSDPEIQAAARRALVARGAESPLGVVAASPGLQMAAAGGNDQVMGGAGADAVSPLDMSNFQPAPIDTSPDMSTMQQIRIKGAGSAQSPLSMAASKAVGGVDPTGTLQSTMGAIPDYDALYAPSPEQLAARKRLSDVLAPGAPSKWDDPTLQLGLGILASNKRGLLPALGDAGQRVGAQQRATADEDRRRMIAQAQAEAGYADTDTSAHRAAAAAKESGGMKRAELGLKGDELGVQRDRVGVDRARLAVEQTKATSDVQVDQARAKLLNAQAESEANPGGRAHSAVVAAANYYKEALKGAHPDWSEQQLAAAVAENLSTRKAPSPEERYAMAAREARRGLGGLTDDPDKIEAETQRILRGMNAYGDAASSPGGGAPAAQSPYKSADDVRSAFRAGKLTREQATKVLRDSFGMQ